MAFNVQRANSKEKKLHIFEDLDTENPKCGGEAMEWGGPFISPTLTWENFDPKWCCEPCWEAHTGTANPNKPAPSS